MDVSGELQSRVLVRDLRASTERETDKEIQFGGVSLRLVITVSAEKLDTKMTLSLPVVTAHAQLQNLRAKASDQIKGYIGNNREGIKPTLLERRRKPADDQGDLDAAVATVHALQAIAAGRSLAWTLNELEGSTAAKAAARNVWHMLAPAVPDNEDPPRSVREQADRILSGK